MSDGEALTERGTHRAVSTDSSTERAVIGTDADAPRSVSAATLTATVREWDTAFDMAARGKHLNADHPLVVMDDLFRGTLAALSVLEQQHADAAAVLEYIGELADAWIAADVEHSEMTPDGWPRVAAARAEMIRDAISGTARAALAAASAAAEGDDR